MKIILVERLSWVPSIWVMVRSKEKTYDVRIDPVKKQGNCTCMRESFRKIIKEESECRHIKFVKKHLEV